VRRYADLTAVALLASGAAPAVALGPNTAVRAPFAVLLILVLPGYAASEAVFADRLHDRAARLLVALALSFSIVIVVSLLLYVVRLRLDTDSWAAALAAVTCGAAITATLRRRVAGAARSRPTCRVRLHAVVLIAAAVLVGAGAVAFARTPLAAKNVQGYTALWIQPKRSAAVSVGVANDDLRSFRYRLDVRVNSSVLYQRQFRLAPGEAWEKSFSLARIPTLANSHVEARLYRSDHPLTLYRLARLQPGVFASR
jgi:uncharacterized membrane protein